MNRFNSRLASLGVLSVALAGFTLNSPAFASQPIGHDAAIKSVAEAYCAEGNCSANDMTSLKAAAKAIAEIKAAENKHGDAHFNNPDANGDGLVSRAEYVAIAPDGEGGFAKKDSNGDGFISEKEAYVFIKSQANAKAIRLGLFP